MLYPTKLEVCRFNHFLCSPEKIPVLFLLQVIGQLDKKFIVCLLDTSNTNTSKGIIYIWCFIYIIMSCFIGII